MSLPNYYPKGWSYHISRSVIDHTYLLDMRNDRVRSMFYYVFGVYTRKYNIKMHALTVVLNHVHFVCTDTNGVLYKFLTNLFRVLAAAMNFILNRTGAFWEPSKSPFRNYIAPGDFNSLAAATAYVMTNGYKHGYTATWHEWPGLFSPMSAIDTEMTFQRPDSKDDYFSDRNDSSMPKVSKLVFSTPEEIDPKTWRKLVEHFIDWMVNKYKQKVRKRPRWRQGMKLTRKQKMKKRDQYRGCHYLRKFAGDKELRAWQIANYMGFVAQHRTARACWEPGEKQKVLFPYGTGVMRRLALVADKPTEALALPDYIDDYIESAVDSFEEQLEFGVVVPPAESTRKRRRKKRR